jgi:hypothetical protein
MNNIWKGEDKRKRQNEGQYAKGSRESVGTGTRRVLTGGKTKLEKAFSQADPLWWSC